LGRAFLVRFQNVLAKALWTKPTKIVIVRSDFSTSPYYHEVSKVVGTTGLVFVSRSLGGLPERRYATIESICAKPNDSAASDLFQSGIISRSNAGVFRSATTGNDVPAVRVGTADSTDNASSCEYATIFGCYE
jgi:hypothetical protein